MPSNASAAGALLPVTVQLNWKHQFEFAAFYAAREQGYYRQAGLHVNLREGGPGIDPVGEVVAGRADFGVGNSSLVIERYRGKPVVALAALMQHSAINLLARRDLGIENVGDLAGKTISIGPHTVDEIEAYLLASGLRRGQVRFVQHQGFKLERLDTGEVDAREVYATNELFWINGREHDYVLFTPRSAGIDLFGNILFTRETVLERSPDIVKRFREASLEGLRYAMYHPEDVIDLILRRYNSQTKSREHLRFEAARLNELIRIDLVEPGYMSPGRWDHVRRVYVRLGMVPAAFNLGGFIYDTTPVRFPAWLKWSLAALSLGLSIALAISVHLQKLNRRLQHEVSERLNAEKALRNNQAAFREFVSHANDLVSHEIQTPLAVIKVHLDVLELKNAPDWQGKNNVRTMQRAVARLQELFGEKLTAIFSATSLAVRCQEVDLHETLPDLIDQFQALSAQTRVSLESVGEDTLKVVVTPEMLKTAVFNLLDNALKYSPPDTPVRVRITRNDACGVIRIANRSSNPIPPDYDRWFHKRVRGNPCGAVSGTGIGLYLVRLIAESHGGQTSAELLEPGHFAVQLALPLAPSTAETKG